MRKIWLLGKNAQNAQMQLSKRLDSSRTGVDYVLALATDLQDIPPPEVVHPSVVFLVDAFDAKFGGFEGVKQLHAKGAKGLVYLFGEPAPELAAEPFLNFGLSGFLPPLERLDYDFAAGLLHHHLNFTGSLKLKMFLSETGRESSELIRDYKSFNQFGKTLAAFLGKFGVDIPQLKNILMGMCLGYVKQAAGHPTIEPPFEIFYGVDPRKTILAIHAQSRGFAKDALLRVFADVLKDLDNKVAPGSVFPELFHVSRASRNLVLLGGSAEQSSESSMEPLMLLVTLGFPAAKTQKAVPLNCFAFCQVHDRPILELAESPPEKTETSTGSKDVSAPASLSVAPVAELKIESPQNTVLSSPLDGQAVDEILSNDPMVLGDAPVGDHGMHVEVTSVARSAETASSDVPDMGPETTAVAVDELMKLKADLQESLREIDRLREVGNAMSSDVRRLMKERRVPTTDKELREAVTELQEKLKRAGAEKLKFKQELDAKDQTIETLKAQVEALRSKAA